MSVMKSYAANSRDFFHKSISTVNSKKIQAIFLFIKQETTQSGRHIEMDGIVVFYLPIPPF